MADEENTIEGSEVPAAGGKKKLIVLAGGAVLLLVLGLIAGPMVMNMISPPAEETDAATEIATPSNGPALYTSLHPPLVVNFNDSAGEAHFMQITMEVMARDQNVINLVSEHVAVIRNSLILLYSSAVFEEVATRAGKEKMLADGLAEIQKVMAATAGVSGIEAVYFTSLIIQ
jgi:flagellar FliL protein